MAVLWTIVGDFIDGTTRKICRPEKDQKVMYNGHKRGHAFKYQSVTAPNGLIEKSLWTT